MDTNMNREGLGTKQANGLIGKDNGKKVKELQQGLEFNSAEEAQEYYNLYAAQTGFKIRIGQLYRSRVDGSVISRRFVCSKEGFQTNSRLGCQAFIRVQKIDSGKWTIATLKIDHNHELGPPDENHSQKNVFPIARSSVVASTRTGIRTQDEGNLNPTDVVDAKRSKRKEGETLIDPYKCIEFGSANEALIDPYKGIVFGSADEAYKSYYSYAARTGFKVRIGQLFRSKNDGSVTSRRFVCSKEGRQHPSRVGCGAFMRIQREESGRWVVDRFSKEHNHDLNSPNSNSQADVTNVEINLRQNNIGNDWYSILLAYFQSRQAVDTGFFYAIEADEGKCGSLFWADGRSRFACSQFGDAIVFDTSYRSSTYSVPFAFFIGVNHHKQPVLLGCALLADESEECFTWIFQTWIRAMSGQRPLSIIADQDMCIQRSIARVFPETHHRFSAWQIRLKERQNLGQALWSDEEFKYEYTVCVSMSRTPNEFDSAWNLLLNRYNLKENAWLKEMYRTRKSWVPLYIKCTFFAGIPMDEGNMKHFFGNFLTSQCPSNEFVIRYEKAVEQRRDEERNEDFSTFKAQTVLHTKDPIEEQGREYYTEAMFKVFQKELLECYGYGGIKINEDGAMNRYLVQKYENGKEERNTVAVNCSNLNVSCSCMMFEFEGVLCRHALKIFHIMNVKELPSRYILHRWTMNAKTGAPRDMDSIGINGDAKNLMLWSLREEASYFVEAGVSFHERYRFAFQILHEGRKSICEPH